MKRSFILKGNICHTPQADLLDIRENGCVVCEDGVCRGVFDEIPARYAGLPVIDCGNKLILPGMVDLHIHASQYAYRGTGMDYELLEWLERVAFPEESRYADAAYALKAYTQFADKLKASATTRAVIFGTVHAAATLILMDCMENSGLVSYVGKVSMDRNAPPALIEDHSKGIGEDTRQEPAARLPSHQANRHAPVCAQLHRRADGGAGRDPQGIRLARAVPPVRKPHRGSDGFNA